MAHILIADDDELIADLATQALLDAGHACGWVTSADAALQLLERKRPDLMLLDHDMPGMSGVTLLRKLRVSERFYDLPVIMFTAMRGADDEAQAIYAGANDFIRKPLNPKTLVKRVSGVLSLLENKPRHTDLKTYLARNSGMSNEPAAPRRHRFI